MIERLLRTLEHVSELARNVLSRSDSRAKEYSDQTVTLLESAVTEATQRSHDYVGTEHVLFAMFCASGAPWRDEEFATWIDIAKLKAKLNGLLASIQASQSIDGRFTDRLKQSLYYASKISVGPTIRPLDLLESFLQNKTTVAYYILTECGVTSKTVPRQP